MALDSTARYASVFLILAIAMMGPVSGAVSGDLRPEVLEGQATIERPPPDPNGGQAYRLTYMVDVPVDIFWRFKTDFDNRFLLTHRKILDHRMVRQNGNVAITETRYRHQPDAVFRWQTTVDADRRRLDYRLTNAKACSQRFHYGTIRISPIGSFRTLVVHTAYFDFFGAAVWARYPWSGGMREFLKYTARWEQVTVARLRDAYSDDADDRSVR